MLKFVNWKIEDVIEYLERMKSAPRDRLDYHCVPRVRGEIIIENGELKPEYPDRHRKCGLERIMTKDE